MTDRTSAPADEPVGTSPRARAMALTLWVVVGALLAYGVAETALKASALFG